MVWPNIQNTMDNFLDFTDQQKKDEQNMLEEDFNKIKTKIENNPEDINKISKNELETVKKFIASNKNEAFDMYINIVESLENTEKLWRRDEKSLNEIKSLIEWKYKIAEIWEYQLNKDVFNETFDFGKLKKIWSYFEKWKNIVNWFRNIPKDYDGENQSINNMCQWKLYTPQQLVKWLYEKNEERKEEIKNIVSEIDVSGLEWIDLDGSFRAGSNNAKIIIKEIKEKWWELADDFWEYPSLVNSRLIGLNTINKKEIKEEMDKKTEESKEELEEESKEEESKEEVKEVTQEVRENNETYTVLPWDTLSKIAKNNNISLQDIKDLNSGLFEEARDAFGKKRREDGGLIYVWDEIVIRKKAKETIENENNDGTEDKAENKAENNENIITLEQKLKDSKDFIWKNIDKNTRDAYAELFEISNYPNISKFFNKNLNSITNDYVKSMQNNLVGTLFDYKWKKIVFTTSDVDSNFWSKTLAALNTLVKDYSQKRFDLMEKSVEKSKVRWVNTNWTFVDFIIKQRIVPITLIDDKIVRRNWEKNYSIFDQNSWIWKDVSVIDNKLYQSIFNFDQNLMVNNIPQNQKNNYSVPQQNMTHPASTTYVQKPNVFPIEDTNRYSGTDQWNSVIKQAK
jgi:hypothetical protein